MARDWSNGILALSLLAVLAVAGSTAPSQARAGDADFRAFLPRFETGLHRFVNGDPITWNQHVSRTAQGSILGGFGGYEMGGEVGARYAWAASQFEESGATVQVEYPVDGRRSRPGLHRLDRAEPGADPWQGGTETHFAAGDARLPARGRRLEAAAPPRGPQRDEGRAVTTFTGSGRQHHAGASCRASASGGAAGRVGSLRPCKYVRVSASVVATRLAPAARSTCVLSSASAAGAQRPITIRTSGQAGAEPLHEIARLR